MGYPFAKAFTWTAALMVFALAASGNVYAGPPFLTDDPDPVAFRHWEINTYISGTHLHDSTQGSLPGLDINYGLLPDVQLNISTQLGFNAEAGQATTYGPGDSQIGVKWRFLEEDPQGWRPAVAVYPALGLPTGNPGRGLGSGSSRFFLPVWVEKNFGKWTTYGGGGYWVSNAHKEDQNYWFMGWAVMRQVTDNLALGGELFHQAGDSVSDGGTGRSSGFNLGGTYDLNEHQHLLFSAGKGLQSAAQTNLASWYLGYQLTF